VEHPFGLRFPPDGLERCLVGDIDERELDAEARFQQPAARLLKGNVVIGGEVVDADDRKAFAQQIVAKMKSMNPAAPVTSVVMASTFKLSRCARPESSEVDLPH
jgi:hypothetical protein